MDERNGKYYHVAIERKNKNNKYDTGIISELNILDYDEVKNDYVIPYVNNKLFYIQGTQVSKDDIVYFKVSETNLKAEIISKQINQNNLDQRIFLTFTDTEAVMTRKYDITSKIIKDSLKESNIENEINFERELMSHLHDRILQVSYKKFCDLHYADSVESAFKEINSRLKKIYKSKTGLEKDGRDLMAHIFSDTSPILQLSSDLGSIKGRNVQEGYRFIFMGVIIAIRNPKAHENQNISKDTAYDRLILASLLMKKIDEAIIYSNIIEH